MPETVLADMGFCIYCGARYYTPETKSELAKEHVVPLALSGDVVLNQASCQECERVTGRFEAKVLRNHLLGPRNAMGLNSRNSYEAQSLPLFVPNEAGEWARERKVLVPIEDFPTALFLPIFPDPPALQALAGLPSLPYDQRPFLHPFGNNFEKTRKTFGIREWAYGSMDVRSFCRMIAKIAHAFAIGTLGPERFNPILPDLIRDPDLTSRAILPFIGGRPMKPPSTVRRHHLEHSQVEIGGRIYLLVNVHLFANLGAPIYCTVIGTLKGQEMPTLPDNPGGVDALHNFYRTLFIVE